MSKKDKEHFKVEELINKLHEVLQVIDKGMMEQIIIVYNFAKYSIWSPHKKPKREHLNGA
jgi:hypothetical protein